MPCSSEMGMWRDWEATRGGYMTYGAWVPRRPSHSCKLSVLSAGRCQCRPLTPPFVMAMNSTAGLGLADEAMVRYLRRLRVAYHETGLFTFFFPYFWVQLPASRSLAPSHAMPFHAAGRSLSSQPRDT